MKYIKTFENYMLDIDKSDIEDSATIRDMVDELDYSNEYYDDMKYIGDDIIEEWLNSYDISPLFSHTIDGMEYDKIETAYNDFKEKSIELYDMFQVSHRMEKDLDVYIKGKIKDILENKPKEDD